MVHWRARLFMADKKIHKATVASIFKAGFCLQFHQAVAVGSDMNVEFAVKYRGENQRIRVKGKVSYCLLRSSGDGADIDLMFTQISSTDNHTYNNILQTLMQSSEVNLRL